MKQIIRRQTKRESSTVKDANAILARLAGEAAATRLELRPNVGKVRAPSRGNAALAAS